MIGHIWILPGVVSVFCFIGAVRENAKNSFSPLSWALVFGGVVSGYTAAGMYHG